ncbi:S8 family serine peptidase [Actinoplanes sp. NPDC023714]|uniref:S8 family serine peptidase n=1 Tax=Actinoplanes sp. NPDC023714 TaxID=3154322 RepID=UPI0033C6B981
MRVVSFSLVAVLLAGLTATPAAAADTPQRLVIGLVPGADATAVVGPLGIEAVPVPGLDAVTVTAPATAIATLLKDPAVRYAEIDPLVAADATADPDGATSRAQGTVNQIPGAWTWTIGDPSVTVAVVDSGVTANEDLSPDRLDPGYDFADGDADPADDDGHGTLIATTIAARHGNGVGGMGVCGQCRIMPVRVLKHRAGGPAEGYASTVAAGIAWAAEQKAPIINLSLSTAKRSSVLEDAVAAATADGALVVASAGDDNSVQPYYPAAFEPTLAVGSSGGQFGGALNASNRNSEKNRWVDVGAWRSYRALDTQSTLRFISGTSASAALVSGIAALGLAMRPGLPAADLRSAIVDTAGRADTMEPEDAPIVDAAALIHSLGGADDRAPAITGLNPANLALVSGHSFRLTPGISDDHAIKRSELEIDGVVARRDHVWQGGFTVTPPRGEEGLLSYTLRVYDYAGRSAEATRTVRFDAIEPDGRLDAPAQDTPVQTGGRVKVVFTATTADTAKVTAEGVVLKQTGPKQWSGEIKPANEGIYVDVYDVAGNVLSLYRGVVFDDQRPDIAIESPRDGQHVRGAVDVRMTQTVREELRSLTVDGVPAKKIGAWTWQARVVPKAHGYVSAVSEDLAGNMTSAGVRLVVDNAGPVATVNPAQNKRLRGTFTTSVTGVRDASGVAKAELWANGKYLGTGYSKKVATGKLNGTVKLVWKLTDKLGNSRTYTRNVIADNKAPTVSITKAPKNRAKVKGTVKVYVSAKDASGVARVELIVNGKVVAKDVKAGYVLSANTKKQKKTMKVRVRAYDKLGNVTYTSVRTWYRK